MPEEDIKVIPVPCPKCGKVHMIPVKEAKENPHVTVPCGAIIGSTGVLRRLEEMENRVKDFKSQLHKLE